MDKIKVTMDILDESLETLSEALLEDLDDKVGDIIDNKIEAAFDDIDFDDKIETWFNYNIDIDDTVRDAIRDTDFSEYIDGDDLDIESNLRSLMSSFSPINACSTGQAAIKVIRDTIRYVLLKDDAFVGYIQTALDKHKINQAVEEAKEKIIEEAKPILREQFQLELTQYADAIEAEKAREILRNQELMHNQQTTTIPLDIV